MSKRKRSHDDQKSESSQSLIHTASQSESSSDNDNSLLDVDFELFDPQPRYDSQGIKMLLRQLFDDDAHLFDIGALANLILAQPLLGSTVKVEGNASDPYGLLTVLNVDTHRTQPVISDMLKYLKDRCKAVSDIRSVLHDENNACIGLILSERLINVPAQLVAPMYKMLLEEVKWAIEEREPYDFSHYLILSKTYQELEQSKGGDHIGLHGDKKFRRVTSEASTDVHYFHPEDEVFHKHAIRFTSYSYQTQSGFSASEKVVPQHGIKAQGHAILIDAKGMGNAVQAVEDYVTQSSP